MIQLNINKWSKKPSEIPILESTGRESMLAPLHGLLRAGSKWRAGKGRPCVSFKKMSIGFPMYMTNQGGRVDFTIIFSFTHLRMLFTTKPKWTERRQLNASSCFQQFLVGVRWQVCSSPTAVVPELTGLL